MAHRSAGQHMETPDAQQHGEAEQPAAKHPITDDDIIAEEQRKRRHDQYADRDVSPEANELPPSRRGG